MHIYRDMLKYGMIDVVVATGASIVDMDFFEALGFKHYQAQSNVDDRDLRDLYIDRIYDTYIDEEELQNCDGTIYEICEQPWSPAPIRAASSSTRWASGWRRVTPRSPRA